MLISSLLGAAALFAVQADNLKGPRDAFGSCLLAYVQKAVQERKSESAFATEFSQQCTAEENAYREALRAREKAMKTPAAEVEEFVSMEIEDARTNLKTRFADSRDPG